MGRLGIVLIGLGLTLAPGTAVAQGLFERVALKAGPSWTAAAEEGASTGHGDRVGSVFLALEPALRWGVVGTVLELGYAQRTGPTLYSLRLVTPDVPTPPTAGGTTRYAFASAAPMARVRLADGPVRLYALAGPRANIDLGTNLAGARDVVMELTGGVGAELSLASPVLVEIRGSLGLTDLSLNGDGVRTRALDLLVGVAAGAPDGATVPEGGTPRPGFVRRVGLKSGVTWGTTAARPLSVSAPGRMFWPFWSGLLTVETRALVGPVAGVLELGFVQRGYARDQSDQAHKRASPSVALLAAAPLLEGAAGTAYALAGPRVVTAGADEATGTQLELTAGLGFDPRCLPVFIEARASASLTDAVPDPDPLWPRPHDAGSYARALDLFIGLVLIDR